jgi:hypothetical protein
MLLFAEERNKIFPPKKRRKYLKKPQKGKINGEIAS